MTRTLSSCATATAATLLFCLCACGDGAPGATTDRSTGGKADDGRVFAEGAACDYGYHTADAGSCGPGLRCVQVAPDDLWSNAGVCVASPGKDAPDPCEVATADASLVPADLATALATVRADGLVTAAEWTGVLAPLTNQLPAGPSAAMRALAGLVTDPGVTLDAPASAGLRVLLRFEGGYPVETDQVTGPAALATLVGGNVTEIDQPLACLEQRAAAAGAPRGAPVTIAVLDSGFDETQPGLAGRLWKNPGEVAGNGADDDGDGQRDDVHGWNFQDGNADLRGGNHGTHVAGLVTAGSDQLAAMLLRVSGTLISSHDRSHVAEAIEYAAAHGARVVNLSRGLTADEVPEVAAALRRHPELFVAAAAGNSGDELAPGRYNQYPLAVLGLPNVTVVAASDETGKKAGYSCFSATLVDVASRGDRLSTVPVQGSDRYDTKEGTSQAAPAIANVAARCLLVDPDLAPATLKQILVLSGAPDVAWQAWAHSGVVDGDAAVHLAALHHLAATGLSGAAAADALHLEGDLRAQLLDRLARLQATP